MGHIWKAWSRKRSESPPAREEERYPLWRQRARVTRAEDEYEEGEEVTLTGSRQLVFREEKLTCCSYC